MSNSQVIIQAPYYCYFFLTSTRMKSLSILRWHVLGFSTLILITLIWTGGFFISGTIIPQLVSFPLIIILFAVCLKRVGWLATGRIAEIFSQFLLSGLCASLISVVAARSSFPYRDDLLIDIDRILFGADWLSFEIAIQTNRFVMLAANYAYASLEYQPILLFTIVICNRRIDIAEAFCTAWLVTLTLTVAIFPFMPALGGYLHYHIPRNETRVLVDVAWSHADVLIPARNGTLQGLDGTALAGIITFPSFHAAAAVIMIRYFWPFMALRLPALVVNIAMIASAPIIGGHYFVDICAGVLTAVLSIILVGRISCVSDHDATKNLGD